MKRLIGLFVVFLLGTNLALAQSLFQSVSEKAVVVGEKFTVEVRVSSPTDSINAVSGTLSFPEGTLQVVSVSKEGSIIDLWTQEPTVGRNGVIFEGVILNPGFLGSSGKIFQVTYLAKKTGRASFSFANGAILANDGKGTNILASLGQNGINIGEGSLALLPGAQPSSRLAALPVITEYSPLVDSKTSVYVKGRGEPDALTKIIFKDISEKSIGEKFIALLQSKKKNLDEVLVKNTPAGEFQYESGSGLVAGVYNTTPFLVEQESNTEKPGLGVQLLVSDSKIVKALVVLINVLGLLIPIVGLAVLIYFIPWYSFKRMRVLGRKLGLEEEKLALVGHDIEREDKTRAAGI
ncbi:MAG: cohesin domain-containing protein [Patescibacteria group bacterium]